MSLKRFRKALYRRVDEMVTGAIAIWIVGGGLLVTAALIKLALMVLIRPFA